MRNPFESVRLPETPIGRLKRRCDRLVHGDSTGGILLLAAVAVALLAANSAFADTYRGFWQIPIGLSLGPWTIRHSLVHWINDGLMTLFFFHVGLHIKRELIFGEFRQGRAMVLPMMAAIGGMVVPALIFFTLIRDASARSAWGIPMATDIALVVGVLALLGNRVPHGLKIFVLSLAIVDDIGAILVIAFFYSSYISLAALAVAAALLGAIVGLNRLGVRQVPAYLVLGGGVWFACLHSGVHPTIAGVALGLLTPASAWIGTRSLRDVMATILPTSPPHDASAQPPDSPRHDAAPRRDRPENLPDITGPQARMLIHVARETVSPLERLETALHPWVMFFILPLFALANSAVALDLGLLSSDVSVGVAMGLAVGKPLGVMAFSLLAVWCFNATLMDRMSWPGILGAACLTGIGFTMSIFITDLSLTGTLSDAGKGGTLIGSVVSCLLGLSVLYHVLPAATLAEVGDPTAGNGDAAITVPAADLPSLALTHDSRPPAIDAGQRRRDAA